MTDTSANLESTREYLKLLELAINTSKEALLIAKTQKNTPKPLIIYSNPAFTEIYGYPPEAIKGCSLSLLEGEETDPETQKRINQHLALGFSFQAEILHYTKSKELIWAEISLVPHYSNTKEINTYWVINLRPIAQRKHFQEHVLRLSSQLNLILQNASLALWMIDVNGIFKLCEGHALQTLNITPGEWIDASIFDIHAKHPEFIQQIQQALAGEISSGTIAIEESYWENHYSLIHKDNQTPVGLIWVSLDITERHKTFLELQEAKEKAEAASKAKSEFLANISHEIRTPLNAILGFSEHLKNTLEDPKTQKLAKSIHRSGDNLLKIITNVLNLSKIESGKIELALQPTSLRELLLDINTLFQLSCEEKQLAFDSIIDNTLPEKVFIDAIRLKQILINLVGNAIKYTKSGSVSIELTVPKISKKDNTADICIRIKDTGIGIAEEDQDKIFEAFTQKCIHAEGVGLGLTIAKRLVDSMNGMLTVSSNLGQGSIFELHLKDIKIYSYLKNGYNQESNLLKPIALRHATILIVDDLSINHEVIRKHLTKQPIELTVAFHGQHALEEIAKKKPDLILLDLKMPIMDGYEFTRTIKKDPALCNIPIIIMTAHAIKEDEALFKELGVESFIHKPVSQQQLLTKLDTYLGIQSFPNAILSSAAPLITKEAEQKLLQALQGDLLQIYQSIEGNFIIGEIQAFAQKIHDLTQEVTQPALIQFSKELTEHIDSFNLGLIEQTLKKYPQLINDIQKSLAGDSNHQ